MSTLITILVAFSVGLLSFGAFFSALGRSGMEPRPNAPEDRRIAAVRAKTNFARTGPVVFKAGVVLAASSVLLLIVHIL